MPDPTPDARARDGLVPQPHGGALRAPFAKGDGVSQGLSRKGTSMRAVRKQCMELMTHASLANTQRMLDLCNSPDDRVAVVALKEFFDRWAGKAQDTPMEADDERGATDLSHLTPDERVDLHAALMTVQRLTGRGMPRTIDGEVDA